MKGIGSLIESIAGGAGVKSIRDVGEFLTRSRRRDSSGGPETPAGEAFKCIVEAIGSEILEVGQLMISGMRRTTGSDDPDNGERFGHGWSRFNDVDGTLETTAPNDSWGGAGSDAYADQNTRQRLRSETMASADRVVHGVLAREAYQIDYHRKKLDGQSNFLGDLSYATFPLQFIPRYGEAAKAAIELTAVSGALQLCALELYHLHSEVNQNAAELQQAVGRYSGVADGAELAGVDFDPPPPPPGSGWPRVTPIERSKRKPSPPVDTGPPAGPPAPSTTTPPPAGGGGAPAIDPATAAADQSTPAMPDVPSAGLPAAAGAAPGAMAGPLGSLLGPLGGLLTGAAQAGGQRAAFAGQPARPRAARPSTRVPRTRPILATLSNARRKTPRMPRSTTTTASWPRPHPANTMPSARPFT